MHILFIISIVAFCALVFAAAAIARHIHADASAPTERERNLPA